MQRISISAGWQLTNERGDRLDPQLFELMEGLHASGKLTEAARRVGLSYRHAWTLVGRWSQFFGHELVQMERGRGATLTPLGEQLLWAHQRVRARLGPQLETLASEFNAQIAAAIERASPTLRIWGSHGYAVARIPELLADQADLNVDVRYRSTAESLAGLIDGDCDLAGVPVPVDPVFAAPMAREHARWLRQRSLRGLGFVARRTGWVVAKGNPLGIRDIADLRRRDVRYVNRQRGSSTRLLCDTLFERAGIAPADVRGYDHEEFTHSAIAAHVASGSADAGLAIETAAREFGLDFVPLLEERYVLIVDQSTLDKPSVRCLVDALRSPRLAAIVERLPGYRVAGAGDIEPVVALFPTLAG
ncbi:MAG: helix-turn-helix transcriptional regulator [Burkholderiales bacterium]|jgi:molybdate transport repressor ModE-like protein|nr:helix-turn-helix transcriptional regulator [Burkholderiales bacterium]